MGSKLTSKRTVAMEVGVSTVTVEHAYELLRDEGYIESRERSGYFVVFCFDDGFVPIPQNTFDIFSQPVHTLENYDEFPFSVLAKTMRRVIGIWAKAFLSVPLI